MDSIVAVDTFGATSPEGFAQLVRTAKKYVKVPIEVHCHNDFGLGTANALEGMAAGASVAHTNVNGIGERAGGASTEEVAVALRILYGKNLGFNCGKLHELSQFVQKVSGVPVSPPEARSRGDRLRIRGRDRRHVQLQVRPCERTALRPPLPP